MVLRDAMPFCVVAAKGHLRLSIPLIGGRPIPLHGLRVVLRPP